MKFKEGGGHSHPIKVAAFDLDGTLVKTKKALAKAHQELLKEQGKPQPPQEEITPLIGHPPKVVFEALHGQYDSELHDRFKELAREKHDLIEPVSNAKQTINRVKKMGLKTVLLTSRADNIDETLAVSGLKKEDFDFIKDGSTAPRKPDGACMDLIAGATGYPPEKIVVIGDGSVDVETAHKRDGYGIGVNLDGKEPVEGADVTIFNLNKVPKIIKKNNKKF